MAQRSADQGILNKRFRQSQNNYQMGDYKRYKIRNIQD